MMEVEVKLLGFEHPDYFQGVGVAFTPYTDCIVGCGATAYEAADDALEQAASKGLPAQTVMARIEAAFAEALNGEPEQLDEHERMFYVSVRWR